MSKLFDLTNVPEEKYVDVYDMNDELIAHTNDQILFNEIRLQIIHNNYSGCYLMFEGKRHNIKSNGAIEDWPYGFFEVLVHQLATIGRHILKVE